MEVTKNRKPLSAGMRFIKTYNEFLSIPIALFLFFMFPKFYREFDGTAGAFDAGYLHILVYAIIVINLGSGISWLMLRLSFPKFYTYFDDEMETDILEGREKGFKKALFPLIIYGVIFISFIQIVAAML